MITGSPWHNRILFSQRTPEPRVRGSLIHQPDAVMAELLHEHRQTRRPVKLEMLYVACNAFTPAQGMIIHAAVTELHQAGRIQLDDNGLIPIQ